ncbi:hypothetical protein FNH13_17650 [Ornithinimicrobium ciconiae]|uniref:Uncharacterized protein n=1 Tax=Ornithinimicrobium ciconiae TaxID=2594265 RepID=A0A516GEI2_9MICO|nr:hypothetical protein [Ornithinimicrobium ciconiae]QDO89926.1 hypothetical protein FNH13_17650 [Ornithinimicrobium ciconiae]
MRVRGVGRRTRGMAVRLAIAAVVVARLAWAGWGVLAQALDPVAELGRARLVAGILTGLWLAATVVSWRRTLETLAHEAHHHGSAAGTRAMSQILRVGTVGQYAAVTATKLAARVLAGLSPVVAVGLASLVWAWVGLAGFGLAGWVAAAVVSAVAGWTLARTVASWQGVALRSLTGAGVLAGLAGGLAVAVVPLLVGVPMNDHAWVGTSLAGAVLVAGLVSGHGQGVVQRRKRAVAGELAAVLGVAQSTLEDPAKARWSVSKAGTVNVHPPLPADVVKNLPGLAERVVLHLPSHEVEYADPHDGVVLVQVREETAQTRALLAQTGGLLTSLAEHDTPTPTVTITAEDLETSHV